MGRHRVHDVPVGGAGQRRRVVEPFPGEGTAPHRIPGVVQHRRDGLRQHPVGKFGAPGIQIGSGGVGEDLQSAGTRLLRRQRRGEVRVRYGDLRQQMDAFQGAELPAVVFQHGEGGILGAAGKIGGYQHQFRLCTRRDAPRLRRRCRQIQPRLLIQCQQRLGGAHGVVAAHAYDDVRLELVQLGQRTAEIREGHPLSDGEELCHPDLLLSQQIRYRRGDPGPVQFRIRYQQRPLTVVDLAQLPEGHRRAAGLEVNFFGKVQCLYHHSPRFLACPGASPRKEQVCQESPCGLFPTFECQGAGAEAPAPCMSWLLYMVIGDAGASFS